MPYAVRNGLIDYGVSRALVIVGARCHVIMQGWKYRIISRLRRMDTYMQDGLNC